MQTYWDDRFHREGRVWGEAPSQTAVYARDRFIENGVRTILVPGAGYGRNVRVFSREEGAHTHQLRYILARKPFADRFARD